MARSLSGSGTASLGVSATDSARYNHTSTARLRLKDVHADVPSSTSARKPALADNDPGFMQKMDSYSLEAIAETKISRFLDQIGSYYPEGLHAMIMHKVERPLLRQILKRTGGNQVHASRILGINRNTLRKKIKFYQL